MDTGCETNIALFIPLVILEFGDQVGLGKRSRLCSASEWHPGGDRLSEGPTVSHSLCTTAGAAASSAVKQGRVRRQVAGKVPGTAGPQKPHSITSVTCSLWASQTPQEQGACHLLMGQMSGNHSHMLRTLHEGRPQGLLLRCPPVGHVAPAHS